MIRVYKDLKDIPSNVEYIHCNDYFFNTVTVHVLDERARAIIKKIDDSEMISKYKIESKYDGTVINITLLSTGCKTVLNTLYFPDKVFCLKECGYNALVEMYKLERGNVFSEYSLVPIEMDEAEASENGEVFVFHDCEDLRGWWTDED